MKRITLFVAMTAFLLAFGFARFANGNPLHFQCGSDTIESVPWTSLDEDTASVLVIFARGSEDCLSDTNQPLPVWANTLFDPSDPISVSRYFRDNSHGTINLAGDVANRGDDSCFFSRHVVCPFWQQRDNWCEQCPWNCTQCPNTNYCYCEYDSFYQDIMSQVDDVTDFSQYDQTGPTGNPDGYVDFVVMLHYNDNDNYIGGSGLARLFGNYETDDGVVVRQGVTAYVPGDYYFTLTLLAHEIGHVMGGDMYAPDWGHNSNSDFSHNAIGGFDVMSHGGFSNRNGIIYPSLFNPWSRGVGLGWTPVEEIESTNFDVLLQPYTDTRFPFSTQSTCYRLRHGASVFQYFLITAHNRFSFWETYWPTEGILTWRANTSLWAYNYSDRSKRKLQLESGSGDWNWTIVDSVYERGWKHVAVRTDTANPYTGFDSLDFAYTLRDDTISFMFAEEAGYSGVGGVGQFFKEGNFMDDYSNPCTRLRIN